MIEQRSDECHVWVCAVTIGVFPAHLTQPCQPSPKGVAGSACTATFACSAFALRPPYSRGHQFVTRYPKASDISSPPCLLRLLPAGANRRVGLAPTGKRRLVTAHTRFGHFMRQRASGRLDLAINDLYHLRCFRELRGRQRKGHADKIVSLTIELD